jgi:hypothetical protein
METRAGPPTARSKRRDPRAIGRTLMMPGTAIRPRCPNSAESGTGSLQDYARAFSRHTAASANLLKGLVGAARFELATPCSRSKCATRLRYAPPDRDDPTWTRCGGARAVSDVALYPPLLHAASHPARGTPERLQGTDRAIMFRAARPIGAGYWGVAKR